MSPSQGQNMDTASYGPMDQGTEIEGDSVVHATPLVSDQPVNPPEIKAPHEGQIFESGDDKSSPPHETIHTEEDEKTPYQHDDTPSQKGFPKWIPIIIGIILLLSVVIGAFVLLGRSKTHADVTLSYWGLWEDEPLIAPLIASYEKSHPGVTIHYEKKTPQNYREKVQVQIKDGRGPDIFRFHNTWVPMLKEVLAPLPKSVMSEDEFTKTFYKVAISDLKINDHIVGIPFEIDGLVMLYNTDSFDKIGLVNPPHTWDELINYAQQLTVPDQTGSLITAGVALGTADNIDHFSDILGWMLMQNGADLKNVESKEAVEVLQKYREFTEEPFHVWDDTMPNSINAFAQGKVAIVFVPSWEISAIKSINPELKFKVAPLPVLPGEDTPLSIANYWVEGVSAASKHQTVAWDFLRYVSSHEQLPLYYKNQAQTRSIGEPYSRVDLGASLSTDPYLASVISQGPYMKSLPVIDRTYDNGLNDQIVVYLKNAVNDSIKGVSYDMAFSTAQKGIQSVLNKYNIK